MTWKPTIVGLALALLVVLTAGWLTVLEVNHLVSTWEARTRATAFLASATRLRGLVANDAEPSRQTRQDVQALFAELREQTPGSANQERRLKELETLLQRAAIQGGSGNGRPQPLSAGGSKEAADSIRVLLNEMEFEQRQTLVNLDQAAAFDSRLAFAFVAVGTILSLTAIIAASLLIFRQSQAARHADLALTEFQRNMEAILSAAGQGVCHFDLNGKITYANVATSQLLGFELAELVGEDGHRLIHHSRADGSPYPVEECAIRKAISAGLPQRIKGEVYWRKDGTCFPVEYVCAPVKADGKITGGLVTFADVSARESMLQKLEKSNERLLSSLDELHQRSSEIERLSEIAQLLQISRSVVEGCKVAAEALSDIFAGMSGSICLISASRNLFEVVAQWGSGYSGEPVFSPDQCWALRRGKPHVSAPTKDTNRCAHTRNGYAASHLCVPMVAQGEAIGVFHLSEETSKFSESQERFAVAIAEQVTLALANLQLQETLRQQSIRDPLTGLFNRRYLEESAERELRRAERHQKPLSVLMMDIDHFKLFNDTFGHDAGDAMLREIGQTLLANVRAEDIASRYGGEELAIVVPDATVEKASERAGTLLELVKHLNFSFRGQTFGSVTMSIGISTYPEHGSDWNSLFHAADLALYRAKKEGRDRVVVAEHGDSNGSDPSSSSVTCDV